MLPSYSSPKSILLKGYGLGICSLLLVLGFGCKPSNNTPVSSRRQSTRAFKHETFVKRDTEDQRAAACLECHADAHDAWSVSHHAHANRLLNRALDDPAFAAGVHEGYQGYSARFRKEGDEYIIQTEGSEGLPEDFSPDMALGYTPLVQYLIPFAGNRWQSTQIAWDPANQEWFDVYDDRRRAGEWGHWTGRGMNWNSQCAWCHMTDYDKNYDPETDAYAPRWVEQGVSCIQCHGKLEGHAEAARASDAYQYKESFTQKQVVHNCATCHSRREELTEDFKVGDDFYDHFGLQLLHARNLYYPDGQILDEVYVYGSFVQSKMHAAGVRCADCHEPHTGQIRFPIDNNMLCQTCHGPQGNNRPLKVEAPVIDPIAHSFHPEGERGSRCVDCHMYETTYMQRDPRRDHGFHIPDPLLTKELGIPNACNRCHQGEGEDVDWAIRYVEEWYGDRMERPERERTRALHAAQQGEPDAWRELLRRLDAESVPIWEASLLQMAGNWIGRPEVNAAAIRWLDHPHPMVRATAIRVLAPIQDEHRRLRPFLEDESRLVRHAAARVFQARLDPESRAYREYVHYLELHADQPAGAASFGQFAFNRGEVDKAVKWLQRAIEYDPNSSPLYRDLAMVHNASGNPSRAIEAFEQAAAVDPRNPEYPYSLGLLAAERGEMDDAIARLTRAVELDPGFDRAFYNLALAHSQTGKNLSAIRAIEQAVEIVPDNPDYLYAAATIYLQIGRSQEAAARAQRALQVNPGYTPAIRLLQQLQTRPPGP